MTDPRQNPLRPSPPKVPGTTAPTIIVSQPSPVIGGSLGGGIPVPMFMPPNGFAGLAQQTAAVQQLYRRRGSASRTRKKRASVSAPRRRAKTAKRGKPARLVKGSAAAKRYMAKIRRKRK